MRNRKEPTDMIYELYRERRLSWRWYVSNGRTESLGRVRTARGARRRIRQHLELMSLAHPYYRHRDPETLSPWQRQQIGTWAQSQRSCLALYVPGVLARLDAAEPMPRRPLAHFNIDEDGTVTQTIDATATPTMTTFKRADGELIGNECTWVTTLETFDDGAWAPTELVEETWVRVGTRTTWHTPAALGQCEIEEVDPATGLHCQPCEEDAVAWWHDGGLWLEVCSQHAGPDALVDGERGGNDGR